MKRIQHSGKVLIVEDSRTERKIMQGIITKGGYEVLVADDGYAGLELAIIAHPDVILSDITMPRVTGLEMCRMLKARDDTRHIPVVFLSALDDMEQVVEGLEAGASDYLSKHLDGCQDVLKTVGVNYLQSLKNRFGPDVELLRDDPVDSDLEGKMFLGLESLEFTSFGVAIFSLRKTPLYMNRLAREILEVDDAEDILNLPPDRFNEIITKGLSTYFENEREFFHEVDLGGREIEVHMEELSQPGRGITGILYLLRIPAPNTQE